MSSFKSSRDTATKTGDTRFSKEAEHEKDRALQILLLYGVRRTFLVRKWFEIVAADFIKIEDDHKISNPFI